MGLFDALVSKAVESLNGLGKDANPGLLDEAGRLVGGDAKAGGTDLVSLMARFKSHGLESALESWIGVGENRKISPAQLQSILGNDRLAEIARRLGMSPADASSALAKLLPDVVDKLTPEGKVPSEETLRQAAEMLSSAARRD